MKIIFIVDDNDTNLMMAKMALEGTYRAFAMPSAQRLFKLAEKIIPDLILLDVEMPEMDGFTVMKQLAKEDKLNKIPVIFLTASEDKDIEKQGLALGAADFITKPFNTKILLERIERVL